MCVGDIRGIHAWAAGTFHPFASSLPRFPDAHLHFLRARAAVLAQEGGTSFIIGRSGRDALIDAPVSVSDGSDE